MSRQRIKKIVVGVLLLCCALSLINFSKKLPDPPLVLSGEPARDLVDEPNLIEQPKKTINQASETLPQVDSEYHSHIFDDICSVDNIRLNHQAILSQAIQSLDERYQHYLVVVTENVKLNLYGVELSRGFRQKLAQYLRAIHQDYWNRLVQRANKGIVLNIVIAAERREYLNYSSQFTDGVELTDTLGVHFGHLNLAFVDYQGSDKKALITAIHEAVHAFNIHLIGRTPKMFNEGIAQFYQHTILDEQGRLGGVIERAKLRQPAYPVMQFFDNEQWPYLNQQKLYFSSWAWTIFMLSSELGAESVNAYMRAEMAEPCQVYSAGEIYELFQQYYPMFEQDHYDWLEQIAAEQITE